MEAQRLPLNEPEQPERETKAERFERLAVLRVNNALKHIRLVGNLANRTEYDYGPDDAAAILMTLQKALNDIETKYRVNSPQVPFAFRR